MKGSSVKKSIAEAWCARSQVTRGGMWQVRERRDSLRARAALKGGEGRGLGLKRGGIISTIS